MLKKLTLVRKVDIFNRRTDSKVLPRNWKQHEKENKNCLDWFW